MGGTVTRNDLLTKAPQAREDRNRLKNHTVRESVPVEFGPNDSVVQPFRTTRNKKEATVGFEPTNNGFAIHRLSHLATSPDNNRPMKKGAGCEVCEA